jgi:uncharacterized repeat protein (TIGR01451 family)
MKHGKTAAGPSAMLVITVAVSLAMLFVSVTAPATAAFSGGGSGTPEDPYKITNVSQLQEMKNNLGASYILVDNIDASATQTWNDGAGFEPIGTSASNFTGSFDGHGHKIYNLYINRPDSSYVGLFGCVGGGGVVEDVGIENVNVVGSDFVGGLVGKNASGTVSNCYSTGSVSGNGVVGGLIGWNARTVSDSYSTDSVSGIDHVGGLVGMNSGTVSDSYSTGSVSGEMNVGGLVGANYGIMSNCYSTGTVSGGGDYVGGLVGLNDETVSNSFWDTQTSRRSTSDGGTGKTTENMKNVRTYTDDTWSVGLTTPWDFIGNPHGDVANQNIWGIHYSVNNGYPFLAILEAEIVIPGVEVSISPSENSAVSRRTVTFNVTVRNTGTVQDTYDLTVSDNAVLSWSPGLSQNSITLGVGASGTATLSVTIPAGTADGASDIITVTATSRADSAATDSVNCIARCVNPLDIEVSISPDFRSGRPESTLTYTVTVTNTGTVSDTYDLAKSDNVVVPNWTSSLSKTPVGPLEPGASENVTLSVTIPQGTLEGVSHRITVTAASKANSMVKDNDNCVARAIESPRPGVEVTIYPSSRENISGGTLRYSVTVTNTGNVENDYDLSAIDNLGWSLTLLPSSVTGVAPGEDEQVALTVEIPDNAADGDSSTITVTATSSENTEVENSASCTAQCAIGGADVTSLTIFPSRFALFPGYSGQVQSLTATLRVGNNPLPNKRITWSATAGRVSPASGTTDALGQVYVVYTAPAVTDETPQVMIMASFAGDNLYQASSGTSLGIPAVRIIVNISSAGGTVVIYVIELDVTVNLLVVPENALSENTDITVVQAPRESISNYKMVSHIFDLGPSGTTFATPSTLTLPYDESELPAGASEGSLAIYRHTSAGGSWERVGGDVDTTTNTVSVQIDHLSEYAVMAGLGGGELPLLQIGIIIAVVSIIAVIAILIGRR